MAFVADVDGFEMARQILQSPMVTVARLADQTGVLLHFDGLVLLSLNETGLFIVDMLKKGATSPEAVVTSLVRQYAVGPDDSARDLDEFLTRLVRAIPPVSKPIPEE